MANHSHNIIHSRQDALRFQNPGHRKALPLVAITMTPTLLIFILFSTLTAWGQSVKDTCISKTTLNDLKQKVYQLYEEKEASNRKIRLLTELKEVDTVFQSKDSLIINYIDDSAIVIKFEKQIYRHGCMTDSVVTHFNIKGNIAYSEWWSITCNNPDTIDNEPIIFKFKSSYYRFEYDKKDRVTKQVIHISTPYTRRIIYSYDLEGDPIKRVERIGDNEFWD